MLARQLLRDNEFVEEEIFILGFLAGRIAQCNTLKDSLPGITEDDRMADLEVRMGPSMQGRSNKKSI